MEILSIRHISLMTFPRSSHLTHIPCILCVWYNYVASFYSIDPFVSFVGPLRKLYSTHLFMSTHMLFASKQEIYLIQIFTPTLKEQMRWLEGNFILQFSSIPHLPLLVTHLVRLIKWHQMFIKHTQLSPPLPVWSTWNTILPDLTAKISPLNA